MFSTQKKCFRCYIFFGGSFFSRHSFLAFLSMGSIDRLAYLLIVCVDLFDNVSREEFSFFEFFWGLVIY